MAREKDRVTETLAACRHAVSTLCDHCKVRSISICGSLDHGDLHELGRLVQEVDLPPHGILAEYGDPARHVFNLTDGMVKTYRLLADGRRQIFAFLIPGDFLGLSLPERYEWTAEAIGAAKLCRFDRARFTVLVDERPQLLHRLRDAAGHELTLAQDHLVLLGRRTAAQRLAAFLLGLRARFARTGLKGPFLPLAMTREDIADHLGLTIETVSRTFSALARDGTLAVVPGGVSIADARGLRSLAED